MNTLCEYMDADQKSSIKRIDEVVFSIDHASVEKNRRDLSLELKD